MSYVLSELPNGCGYLDTELTMKNYTMVYGCISVGTIKDGPLEAWKWVQVSQPMSPFVASGSNAHLPPSYLTIILFNQVKY